MGSRGIKAKEVIIMNDNGSQLLAHNVRNYINDIGAIQEFTHLATPGKNSNIESLFSNLERELLQRTWFDSLFQAGLKRREYFKMYNFQIDHRSLGRRSPNQFIQIFFPMIADKHPFAFSVSLSRMASAIELDGGDTCLVLDKKLYKTGQLWNLKTGIYH